MAFGWQPALSGRRGQKKDWQKFNVNPSPLLAFDFTAMKNLEIQQAQGIAGPENAFHVRNPDTGEIFATCKGSRRVNQFETEERARMFAAAPELLQIAKAYRNLLKTMASSEGEVATFEHVEGVILRAEGGK